MATFFPNRGSIYKFSMHSRSVFARVHGLSSLCMHKRLLLHSDSRIHVVGVKSTFFPCSKLCQAVMPAKKAFLFLIPMVQLQLNTTYSKICIG